MFGCKARYSGFLCEMTFEIKRINGGNIPHKICAGSRMTCGDLRETCLSSPENRDVFSIFGKSIPLLK